jgi:hypothetical protein
MMENLLAVSWVLPNATPSKAPSRSLPRPQSGLSAPGSSGSFPPSQASPALRLSPTPRPGDFPKQHGWAAALTFSSSQAHQREGTVTAVQLLCDRSKRAVKMDARPRCCHYVQGPLLLCTARALPLYFSF